MEYTHLVKYGGKAIEVTVTDTESAARTWVERVKSVYCRQGQGQAQSQSRVTIVGLNCKWSPYLLRGITNATATLQLCVDATCLVLQLRLFSGFPRSVARFLSNPSFRFVGLEVGAVRLKLNNEYGLDLGNRVVDVRALARMHFPLSHGIGLKALAARLLGLPAIKPATLPWKHLESPVLDDQAVITVCVDAYVSYRIGHMLLK